MSECVRACVRVRVCSGDSSTGSGFSVTRPQEKLVPGTSGRKWAETKSGYGLRDSDLAIRSLHS